jgi:hypothetical protein
MTVTDRAVFRAAAASSVLLCLSWDFAAVVLFIVLPIQLAAIGLLYWGADGLFGPGAAGSGQRPGHADRVSVQAFRGRPAEPRHR